MSGALELNLGPPPTRPGSINAERRKHWAQVRREITGPWRDWMWAMSLQHKLPARVRGRPCQVQFVLPFGDRRRRDPHNYLPTIKACIDGMVLAKVWPDDTAAYVTVVDPQLVVGRDVLLRIGLRKGESDGSVGESEDQAAV